MTAASTRAEHRDFRDSIADADAELLEIQTAELELRLFVSAWAAKHEGDARDLDAYVADLLNGYFQKRRADACRHARDAAFELGEDWEAPE